MNLHFFHKLKLETKLSLLTGALFFVPLLFGSIYIGRFVSEEYHTAYTGRALNAARFIASSSLVSEELRRNGQELSPDLALFLQDFIALTHVHSIVPITMKGNRLYTNQEEDSPPRPLSRDEALALQGETSVFSTANTLGLSQRAVVPVYDGTQTLVGAVSVVMMLDGMDDIITNISLPIQKMMLISMILGLLLVILLAQSIKKVLLGLEPDEIATLLQERSAMLQSMTEGVIAVNDRGQVSLVNDEAGRILHKAGVDPSRLGKDAGEVPLVDRLTRVMASGEAEFEDEQNINGITVLANHMPVTVNDRVVGAVSTFKDMSEVRQLAERITDINRYVDALRSQSHEYLNKLHVILGLLNGGKLAELRDYVEQLVDSRTQEDKVIHDAIKDPLLAGFLSSKYSMARERGINISFVLRGVLPALGDNAFRHGLITILGNLLDNAMDAVRESPEKRLSVRFAIGGARLALVVADTGEGMDRHTIGRIFYKGFSTKGEHRGLGLWLVKKTIESLQGGIEVVSEPEAGTRFTVTLPLCFDNGENAC